MTKFYNREEFRELNAEWRDKLKMDGFRDIEYGESSPYLQDHHLRTTKAVNRSNKNGDAEYYRAAGAFYWDYRFDCRFDKLVWKLHSTGYSEREIVKELRLHRNKNYRVSRFPVNNSINKNKKHLLEWMKEYNNECN